MGGPREGPDFQNLHRNKRSITLNLKEADGVAILRKLIEKTDVIVETSSLKEGSPGFDTTINEAKIN